MIERQARYLAMNDIGKYIEFNPDCHPKCGASGKLEKLESFGQHSIGVTVWGERHIISWGAMVRVTGQREEIDHGTQ